MFVAGASAAVHADMGDQLAPEPSADLGFDVMPLPATPGYRSGVACMGGGPRCIAVGPSGVDAWDGEGWEPVSATGYDAIDITGNEIGRASSRERVCQYVYISWVAVYLKTKIKHDSQIVNKHSNNPYSETKQIT